MKAPVPEQSEPTPTSAGSAQMCAKIPPARRFAGLVSERRADIGKARISAPCTALIRPLFTAAVSSSVVENVTTMSSAFSAALRSRSTLVRTQTRELASRPRWSVPRASGAARIAGHGRCQSGRGPPRPSANWECRSVARFGSPGLLASHVFVDVRDNPAFEDRCPDGYGEDIFE